MDQQGLSWSGQSAQQRGPSDAGSPEGLAEVAALVVMAREGQSGAFEALMARYKPLLMGYVIGRTRHFSDSEDICQEVWIVVFQRLGQLRHPERFGPWLLRIARNKCLDHWRAKGRQQVVAPVAGPTDESGSEPQWPDPAPGPAVIAGGRETRSRILEAVGKLRTRYRVVVYMRLFEEATTVEIARQLDLKESAVRMRLQRGLEQLRKRLRQQGYGPQ